MTKRRTTILLGLAAASTLALSGCAGTSAAGEAGGSGALQMPKAAGFVRSAAFAPAGR